MTIKSNSLQQQLADLAAKADSNAPKEVLQVQSDNLASAAQQIAGKALQTGKIAPNFTLPNVKAQNITLTNLLAKGPVVLTFYRGDWCPYCNSTLLAYQKALPQIQELGASLVAISPQTPDNSMTTAEKRNLTFEILSDVGNNIARKYGLVFKVNNAMRDLMQKWGADIAKYNGDNTWEVPVPGTFVIGQVGIVKLAFVDPDFRKRLEPEEIINALKRLSR